MFHIFECSNGERERDRRSDRERKEAMSDLWFRLFQVSKRTQVPSTPMN